MSKGSKGVLEGLSLNSKEIKNLGSEELSLKRSYCLKPSTVKKLQELKIFVYADPNVTFNEIVDEAICLLYNQKKENK